MKACEKNKMALSLLATGDLREELAARLRLHLDSCPGCREYFREISGVAGELKSLDVSTTAIETPAMFHRDLKRRIASEKRPGLLADVFAFVRWRGLGWRFAVPATAALALMALLVWTPRGNQSTPQQVVPAVAASPELPPTFGAYHDLANNSWDALDRELTREAATAPTGPPVLAASSLARAISMD